MKKNHMDHVDTIIAQWARERPDLDITPMALVGRVLRLNAYLTREMGKTFANHGLNMASFDVLATLRRSGPPYSLSPGVLIDMTMVTSGTMTNRIDQLVKAGLVERVKNPEDGRGFLISLTPKGGAVIDGTLADHIATQARLTDLLSDDDRQALTGLMAAYLTKIEADFGL